MSRPRIDGDTTAVRIHLCITETQYTALYKLARASGLSKSEHLRKALSQYLESLALSKHQTNPKTPKPQNPKTPTL